MTIRWSADSPQTTTVGHRVLFIFTCERGCDERSLILQSKANLIEVKVFNNLDVPVCFPQTLESQFHHRTLRTQQARSLNLLVGHAVPLEL
jgi:hypothetical protein